MESETNTATTATRDTAAQGIVVEAPPHEIQMTDIDESKFPAPARQKKHAEDVTENNDRDIHVLGIRVSPSMLAILIRMAICAFAILLLWATSLNVAGMIVDLAVPEPTIQLVADGWDVAIHQTLNEKDNYDYCAQTQLAQCNTLLNQTVAEQNVYTQRAQTFNANQVYGAKLVTALCQNIYVAVVAACEKWEKVSVPAGNISYFGPPKCSASDKSQVQLLLHDISQSTSNAYVLNEHYTRQNALFQQYAAQNVSAYLEYNRQYLHNKTKFLQALTFQLGSLPLPHVDPMLATTFVNLQAQLNVFLACATLQGGCAFSQNLESLLDQQFDPWVNWAKEAENQIDVYVGYWVTWQYRVDAVINNVANFFAFLYSFGQAVLPFALDLIPNIYLPAFPQWPGLPPLPPPPNFKTIEQQLRLLYPTNFTRTLSSLAAELVLQQQVLLQLQAALAALPTASLPTLFADYNPPPVYLFQPEQHAAATAFLQQSAATLGQIQSLPAPPSGNAVFNHSLVFVPDLRFASLFSFNFEPFSGKLQLTPTLAAFYAALGLLVVSDYLWRVSQSFRIIATHWSNAGNLGLPQVDCQNHKNEQPQRVGMSAMQMATSPLVVLPVIGIIFVAALSVFASVYLPFREMYIEGCVSSNSGTILTNNTFAVAFNFAASGGDKKMATGLQQYDAVRSGACSQNLKSSTQQQANDQQSIASNTAVLNQTATNLHLIKQCVDPSSFPPDPTFNATTGFPNPFATLATPQASNCAYAAIAPFQSLQQGQYNCSKLPPCTTTCQGPNKAILRLATWVAGCRTEWMIHAAISRFFATALVFVCLNLSRSWCLDALRRYHWRSLAPGASFAFVGSVTRDGKLKPGLDQDVVQKLDQAIAGYERSTYLLFGMALLIHVPYIVILEQMNVPFAFGS